METEPFKQQQMLQQGKTFFSIKVNETMERIAKECRQNKVKRFCKISFLHLKIVKDISCKN